MRPLCRIVQVAVLAIAVIAAGGSAALAQSSAPGAAGKSDPAAVVETARKRVAGGDLSGTVTFLAAYVQAHPGELAPSRYLGDLYYRSGDVASAERTYLAILTYAPDDRETHNRLGGIYAAADRISDAIAEFQKSLPDNAAYTPLVELHRRLGDLDRFEARYRRAAESAPDDAAALYGYGAVLRSEHKSVQAVAVLQAAVRLAPLACAPLAELGSAYLDLGRNAAAVDVLQQCLSSSPKDYGALVNLSDAFIAEGQFGRSRGMLERAIGTRPDGSEALVNLGYLEDVDNRWQNAIAFYVKAIGANPLDRDAYVDLGFDYDEHHLFALAQAAFLKGLSVSPNDGRLHYLLAVTYEDQGKRDLARTEFRRAESSDEPEVAHAASHDLLTLQ
jgi:tetratricopeptide (TPR) repeat protein